nr:putative oxidoreductase TDA3 [Tanacetum cinerariifolium]GEX45724.1 putative oxidoreductase TDA3 [Tanacetum cinerariifolium]
MEDNLSEHQPPKRVVICGGGIIGVCTAYYLAKKGVVVTLIERSSIACAASGKAGGFLALHMCDDGPLSSLARTSFDFHRSLAQELDGSQSYGYHGGVKPGEIIGTTETTAHIYPQLFTRALLAKAVALGPWTSKLSEVLDKFRVYGKKERIQLTPEVYPRPTGEVYICGPSVEAEIPDGPELVYPDPESTQVLKKVAGIVSSHLKEANARVTTEQACYMPCTDDELPIIGEVPGMNKCYVASRHGCWGILFGPATGAAMAELMLDGHASTVDLNCFTPARFATNK